MAKYRRRVEIIADILKVSSKRARKTRIMYAANLSYNLLEKYLREAMGIGFVQANGDGYEITEKGRSFLDKYLEFTHKYSKILDLIETMRFEREVLERMSHNHEEAQLKSSTKRRQLK
jgi:predicted transcriptional regulator